MYQGGRTVDPHTMRHGGRFKRSAGAVHLFGRLAHWRGILCDTRGIIVAPSVSFDAPSTLGIWHFWIFTHFHPFPPLFTIFSSSPPWTPTLWCGPLSWGDGLPGFCLTTVECPIRGRTTADEDACLYHKWKPEVHVDSLLQASLPPGPVEDAVDYLFAKFVYVIPLHTIAL